MAEPRPAEPLIDAAYGVPTDASGAEMLPWSWAEEQLTASRNYWICTTRPDGRPHASPVWGLWLDGTIWFSCGGKSQKARNLANEPRVVVHLESGDDVVVLEGRAEQAEISEAFLGAYAAKYGYRPPADSPVWRVLPESAYTWREQDYPRSVARWLFD